MTDANNRLRFAARAAFLFNATASGLMVLFLRNGLDPSLPLTMRLQFIAEHKIPWQGSWLVWIFSALSLIHLFVCWGRWLWADASERSRNWIVFGVLAGSLGMIPDTLAETIYLGLLPSLATDALGTHASHLTIAANLSVWLAAAQIFTGFLGNSFYCLGGLSLCLVMLRDKKMPHAVTRTSLFIWLTGFGLSATSLTQNNTALITMTALTMGSFILWTFWLGWLWQNEGEP
jgi:hypothetical protein